MSTEQGTTGVEMATDKTVDTENGVGILSDEQTNAALAALQEASTIVIEQNQKEAEEGKKAEAEADAQAKKRKAEAPAEDPEKPPAKKRSTPMRVSWEDRMDQLREYKEKHGDLLIPIRYSENKSLGKFVHNTREQYKLFHKKTPEGYKKKCSLTAERVKQLDDIGFVWSTERTKRQNDDWENRLDELKAYKEKHGVSSKMVLNHKICPSSCLLTFPLFLSIRRIVWFHMDTPTLIIPVIGVLPNGFIVSEPPTQP